MSEPTWKVSGSTHTIRLADGITLGAVNTMLATANCDAIGMDVMTGARDEREARLFALRAFLDYGEAFAERLRLALDVAAELAEELAGE